jgi:hypothetical protein
MRVHKSDRRAALLALAVLAAALWPAAAPAQQPAPPQGPPGAPPGTPPGARSPGVTMLEDLVRQGFEVKAMENAGGGEGRFVVLLQRSGEVRTCLLRIDVPRGTTPVRRSVCF